MRPGAAGKAVWVGQAAQHPPEALHDRIRIAGIEPLLQPVNLGVVPVDGFLLCSTPLRVGLFGCLKAPQSLALGRSPLGERLPITSLGIGHRSLIPTRAPEQPPHRAWLGRCERFPLPHRKRLGVRTRIKRRQLHRAPEILESSPGLSS